jgi:hypothetical protein
MNPFISVIQCLKIQSSKVRWHRIGLSPWIVQSNPKLFLYSGSDISKIFENSSTLQMISPIARVLCQDPSLLFFHHLAVCQGNFSPSSYMPRQLVWLFLETSFQTCSCCYCFPLSPNQVEKYDYQEKPAKKSNLFSPDQETLVVCLIWVALQNSFCRPW